MIIGLSVFTFLELRFIERKIIFGEAISEFFDTTLEIRRFEKNYFLYEQAVGLPGEHPVCDEGRGSCSTTTPTDFAALSSAAQVDTLRSRLADVPAADGPVCGAERAEQAKQTGMRTRPARPCSKAGSA